MHVALTAIEWKLLALALSNAQFELAIAKRELIEPEPTPHQRIARAFDRIIEARDLLARAFPKQE